MIAYADLHVHVGYANDRYIKIPSSKNMTIENILYTAKKEKGLNVISLVDFLSGDVLVEFNSLVKNGIITLKDNNYYYDDLLIVLGAEIELRFNSKGFHCLLYFENYQKILDFIDFSKKYFSDSIRSCPVFKGDINKFEEIINRLELTVIPAHVFTPYKGFYSSAYKLKEVFKNLEIYAIELGLSADTPMVQNVDDINNKTFLSNSDAHSIQNIAREFNEIEISDLTTTNLINAILNNSVISNYGINPKLGKYHKTFCKNCKREFNMRDFSSNCPYCMSSNLVIGVEDRINILKKMDGYIKRPPYYYTFPFELVDGFGKKTRERILSYFENEINFIKSINSDFEFSNLHSVLGTDTIKKIEQFKNGEYNIKFGAGGYFGRIRFDKVR